MCIVGVQIGQGQVSSGTRVSSLPLHMQTSDFLQYYTSLKSLRQIIKLFSYYKELPLK